MLSFHAEGQRTRLLVPPVRARSLWAASLPAECSATCIEAVAQLRPQHIVYTKSCIAEHVQLKPGQWVIKSLANGLPSNLNGLTRF